ncbi:MAG: molecular chaperone HtpG, partial [Erysipelotrichaceae bacterium]|nr:molecular chaperone HtpG [Erysipelotrichaceae bacterium]
MAVKQFKTESKRLLDMMANSIYTNTDIFLRELISNASDALDKRHILSLTDPGITSEDPKIHIDVDKKNRMIT